MAPLALRHFVHLLLMEFERFQMVACDMARYDLKPAALMHLWVVSVDSLTFLIFSRSCSSSLAVILPFRSTLRGVLRSSCAVNFLG